MTKESAFDDYRKYEYIEFFFRKHWSRFLEIIILNIFLCLLCAGVLIGSYHLIVIFDWQSLYVFYVFFASLITFVCLQLIFLPVFNYFLDTVIVTNTRVIMSQKTVFLKNESNAIDLTKIQDIAADCRGLLPNYLGYGRLLITLSASIPPFDIEDVPRPHYYLERANRVKREHILRRQERRWHAKTPSEIQSKREGYLQDVHELRSN